MNDLSDCILSVFFSFYLVCDNKGLCLGFERYSSLRTSLNTAKNIDKKIKFFINKI